MITSVTEDITDGEDDRMQSPSYIDACMHPVCAPEFFPNQPSPAQSTNIPEPMEQMFQAVSSLLHQVNQTNQTLLTWLSPSIDRDRPDSKVQPKAFSGIPTEDVLMWLDHFKNITSYHQRPKRRKVMEAHTLFENVGATWFSQQEDLVKEVWPILKHELIQNFTHNNVTQTALQQLRHLRQ